MTGKYSAAGAALGGRTLKTGQSRWFIGYKKHTVRLWLSGFTERVVLVPLVSWLAPGNRGEALFLRPSVRYCAQSLGWLPDFLAGDMAYINLKMHQEIRERWNVAVITKLRANMRLVPPFEAGPVAVCPQGQPLEWLDYEAEDQEHWFGVRAADPLCAGCWEQNRCLRQFNYPAARHEILLGLLPLASQTAQQLLKQARPWIEPAQSYEKNQLGLKQMFLNSLRLAWTMGLLADAAVLLRAHLLLKHPPGQSILQELMPRQMALNIKVETNT